MDLIAGILILAFSFSLLYFWGLKNRENRRVEIYHKQSQVRILNLKKDQHILLSDIGVPMEIEISDDKVRVKSSDCPLQICVKKGWTGLTQDPIICMPNHIMVVIKGDEEDVDAVSQ